MLITFLWENLDVFAWQISDMPGIPREVIEHKLGIDPSYKPIKQKERKYTSERPSGKKSINYLKLGSLGKSIIHTG
jgi:hypothetical protein